MISTAMDVAQNATAAGTVSGDKMSLDVLTSDIQETTIAFSAALESWTKDCYGNHLKA